MSLGEGVEKGYKNDDIINDYPYFGLHYPDFDRFAAGRQGRQHGCRIRRIQSNRFRLQRGRDFFGKNDGGGCDHLHADIDHADLYRFAENIRPHGRSRGPRDKTGASRRAKAGAAARVTLCVACGLARECAACVAPGEVRVLFQICRFFRHLLHAAGLQTSFLLPAEVVELVDTLS